MPKLTSDEWKMRYQKEVDKNRLMGRKIERIIEALHRLRERPYSK